MADGQALEIDDQILHLVNGVVENLPIHLGQQAKDDWEAFIELSTVQHDSQQQERTFQFGELYVTDVADDRRNAPTKTTARTHRYTLDVYIPYLTVESYLSMRVIHQQLMDVIHNNPRPEQGSNIVSISPAQSDIGPAAFANELLFYKIVYTFSVLEYVAHD